MRELDVALSRIMDKVVNSKCRVIGNEIKRDSIVVLTHTHLKPPREHVTQRCYLLAERDKRFGSFLRKLAT